MPYELKKVEKNKFKVCKKDDKKICFSKKGLSKKTAKKQKYAIEQSERRRFGMGRTTDNIMPQDYNRYYEMYVKRFKKKYPDLEEFSVGDFINDYSVLWSDTNDTSSQIINQVVKSTKKYHDLRKQTELDTDDESVDKVKARTSSNISELTMGSENQQVYDIYIDQLEQYNTDNDEEIEPLTKEQFISTYENDYDDDLEPDDIIEQIIDEQAEGILGKSTEEEREELALKIGLAIGFVDDGSKFPDFESQTIISASDIHDKKTSDDRVNYKQLKEMYDYILKKCKENTKGGFCGWFVDSRVLDNNLPPNIKNYGILRSLVFLVDQLNQGRYSIWCKDKCSEETWGFNLFSDKTFGIVFKHQNDEIMMSAGCRLTPQSDSIYINLLCGLGGGKYIMEAFKRLYNQDSEDDLWTKVGKNEYKYLSLGSVSSYITVMFYYKQGLIEEESNIEPVMKNFEKEIKERIDDGTYDSFAEYCEDKLPYFESGNCETDDQYLNDIFTATGCGGSKYLYPEIDIKLGETKVKINKIRYVSYDYLKGFADYCKNVIKNPEDYTYKTTDKIKEGVMEVFKRLPAKARNLRTEKLRTKRMLRNPDLPRENLVNQRLVNRQLSNVTSELDVPGESPSVDRIANKPRFAESRMGLDKRTEQTRINRLQGNEPRTAYLRRKNFENFRGELGRLDFDPFETGNYLVPETVLNRRNRTTTTRMVEPPQLAPKTTEDYIITEGDPREGRGVKGTKFYEELKGYGIDPVKYLSYMKKQAKKAGYDEKQLTIDNDDKHKLRISTEDGVKHFGAVGYKDNFIYQHLEKMKKVPKGTAKQMRDRFQKSHGAITTKRKLGRNSANELALKILW